MQRRMSVPEVAGKTPGEKFDNAIRALLSASPEKLAEVKAYTPKKRTKPAVKKAKASARQSCAGPADTR